MHLYNIFISGLVFKISKYNVKKRFIRKYANFELVAAAKMVNEQKMSIYKAAKINGVPWSSLKDFLKRDNVGLVPKMGRPYALTSDLEIQILNYIIKMQELGFGLTVFQVRKIAHKTATAAGRGSYFNLYFMNLKV